MKKIGIITLNGYFNFGNRLQNYALQETLKSFDYEVDTIWVENIREIGLVKSKTMNPIKNTKRVLRNVQKRIYLDPLNNKRTARFEEFSKRYIKEHDTKITENYLPEHLLSQYDYFVTGSDQVWNPYFTKGSPLYHLTFAPKEKRVAYAPSFGVSEIPKKYATDFQQWLSEMASLSVREEAGAKIIKQMTGREAEVVADPTMLLTREQWLEVAKPAKNKPKEDILLTYYLGRVPKSTEDFIINHAKKHGLKVVNLVNIKEKEHYLADPAEFLDYINSAKLFVTDSFHGAVFSILFETPFVVTDRVGSVASMNSRITTLLSKYSLENRHIDTVEEEEVIKAEYSHVGEILDAERKVALNYLGGALKQ